MWSPATVVGSRSSSRAWRRNLAAQAKLRSPGRRGVRSQRLDCRVRLSRPVALPRRATGLIAIKVPADGSRQAGVALGTA